MDDFTALAFGTGGTVPDWHGALIAALAERAGGEHDWHDFVD